MSRRGPLALIGVVCLGSAPGCSSLEPRLDGPIARVEEPHAAALPDGRLVRVWGAVSLAGEADIACQVGDEPPVRLNPRRGSAVAGRQVGPRVAVSTRGVIVVAWIDRAADAAGDVVVARSIDGGRRFSRPVLVHEAASDIGQEYQDLAVTPDGGIAVSWLDERGAPPGEPNRKQVWVATSVDGGRTFDGGQPLTASPAGVCPCCRPGLTAGRDGALHLIYRDRAGTELYLRVATRPAGAARFLAPVTVSRAGWAYSACPVDAPAILTDARGNVHVAWMDGSAGSESLWWTSSADGGSSFAPARPLVRAGQGLAQVAPALFGSARACCADGTERQGRPTLAWDGGRGLVAAWEQGGEIWLAAPDAGEGPGRIATGASPCLVASGDGLELLWSAPEASLVGDDGLPVLRSRLAAHRVR